MKITTHHSLDRYVVFENMIFKLDFNTKKNVESLIIGTNDYFLNQGFDQVKSSSNSIEFKRGSLILNRFTFNPLKWKSRIEILFNQNGRVKAEFKIDHTHQIVTTTELELWETFVNNYEKSLILGKSFIQENKDGLKRVKKSSTALLIKIVGFVFIVTAIIVTFLILID